MDYQVKIRGYRIELGEIENHLMDHSLIKEAVVIDREDDSGKKYLCAYYVSDSIINFTELRDMLATKMPGYMIPSSFTRLDKIPLTPNGKTDRRALPEPEIIPSADKEYSGPRNEIDEKLIAIWSKVLKVREIGIDDNFFEIGGDSLTILEIQIEMLKYNWSLNTQEFYKYNTIRGLSDRLSGIGRLEPAYVAEDEVATSFIANETEPVIAHRDGYKYKNVLLTGATGFLGIHLLKELLSNTDASVYCIVRGQTDNNAGERLIRLMEFYFPDEKNVDYSRLFIYRGDVTKYRFGLNEKVYEALGHKVELVIHTAAIVKYYGDYEDFRKTNVIGTENVADFCMEFDKPLAHISTLGVSGNYLVAQENPNLKFTENDFFVGQRFMDNVYIRSKFEAESLIYDRMQRGLMACVFRIGNLTGRYSDGHFQQNADENAFYNILRSLIKLGAINDDVLERRVEFTPVDCCSRAILTLLNVQNFPQRVYHVFNHNLITMKRMLEIFKAFDINVTAMGSSEFSSFIDRMVQDDYKNKYLVGIINDLGRNKSLDFSTLVNIDSSITKETLEQLGFIWPEVNEAYLGRIVRYMRASDYLG
jgi:thioester reductase-like protein